MKYKLHPFFIVVLTIMLFYGEIVLFISTLLTAILHEWGHAIFASRRGAKLNDITLLPCGAVLNLEKPLFSVKDEILLACSGPIVNWILAGSMLGVFYLFPSLQIPLHPFFIANVVTGSMNLLPFFPLDGSRVVIAALSGRNRIKSIRILRYTSFLFAGILLLFSFFPKFNVSLLLFSLLIFLGTLSAERDYVYERMTGYLNVEHGADVQWYAISQQTTLLKAVQMMNHRKYSLFIVTDARNRILTGEEIFAFTENYALTTELGHCLRNEIQSKAT